MTRALVLGGTGQIGIAVARRLLADGWDVDLASRGRTAPTAQLPDGARGVVLDRDDTPGLEQAATGADLLVDAVCYTRDQARQLVGLGDRVGALHVVSTLGVYADSEGRYLGGPTGAPEFPVPVTEDQPTVAAGDDDYPTRKVAVEEELLAGTRVPLTISRPGTVHGVGSVHPREWWFVRRALDGRRFVPLAHRGTSRFQTTAAANLAEVVALAAGRQGSLVVDVGDPECPTVLEIARAVAAATGAEWTEVLLPGDGPAEVGSTPWSVPHPFVVSTARAASELGYRPVTTYADAVPELVSWLLTATTDRDWREVFPIFPEHYGAAWPDYAAEDRWLAGLAGTMPPDADAEPATPHPGS